MGSGTTVSIHKSHTENVFRQVSSGQFIKEQPTPLSELTVYLHDYNKSCQKRACTHDYITTR